MPVLYPSGVEEKDIYDPGKSVETYKGEILLLAILPSSAGGGMYAAELNMLLCSSQRCMPDKQVITGHVPEKSPLLEDVAWKEKAAGLLENQAESFGALSVEEGSAPPPIMEEGKEEGESISPDKKLRISEHDQSAASEFNLHLDPTYADPGQEIYSLGNALLLGILAGLLLNAMPCVLPVLTLKVSGLLMMGNLADKKKLHHFRVHNLFFAAGIITFFTLLAFLLGAADLMWGQLYQNQAILLGMLVVVFLMGLSMLGVFTLPVIDLRIGANSESPRLQAYCTGLISTFLATPCSGPLLGGALAWAFTQPMIVLLAVFWAIGLGMALPYLIFCIWPKMAFILPRPGKWMYVFEHLLGFLLLATAIYLLSILPEEKYTRILAMLLLAACGAWLWGKFCGPAAPLARKGIVGTIAALLVCGSFYWILRPLPAEPQWREFTPQTFMSSLGKKNMLVEFTADWCPNCKFLEATALSSRNLDSWRKRYNMELIKVDLTNPDPYAEKLLDALGSKSIPLTALFSRGAKAREPVALRDIYTRENLEKWLSKTFGDS